MKQATSDEKVKPMPVLLRLAFRPLFLLGGAFSCVALVLWGLALSGQYSFAPYGNILFWHSHEMIFGFVSAIVVGFLLTAVQNWTSIPSIKGKKLAVLVGVWLLARVLMLMSFTPQWLMLAIDVLFLPLAGYWLAKPIIAVGQTRNLFFVPIIVLLSAANLFMHLGVILKIPALYSHGFMSAIWLITLLMSLLGGRVIPFFTANATKTPKPEPLLWLEIMSLGSTLFICVLFFVGAIYYIPATFIGILMVFCAVAHVIRAWRWHFSLTLNTPLLWSLHVAYWCIPVGVFLIGLSYLSNLVTVSTAFHALTVGAMGNMILSMMARVSLGHTGRQLIVRHSIIIAFALILIAAIVRVFGALLINDFSHYFIFASVIAWCLAYGVFVLVYFPILTKPRADGRPG
ncbi:NnrS family protein [Pseudoalteromonas sp. PA2MD11]|uniref:NnrS family protein n=1 Tax=Pseudoalteromonas sp. PA2MD11 TaxID=2785057 RepID=UPI001ADF312A|nr:NnrS family protein [Pseudoalteromonas sp. PA2MD11]